MRAVAAGAAGIDQMFAVGDRHLGGEFAHHHRGGGISPMVSFFTRRPVIMRGDHHRADLAGHDLAHQRQHFLVEDFAVFDQAQQRFLGLHSAGLRQEILQQRMAVFGQHRFGWNCTPSTASVLWRTPMISPSSVQAVISRQSGSSRARSPASGSASP
jgi:hypothetical protein